jgi:transcriptional regulator with XRE-family HTH domain
MFNAQQRIQQLMNERGWTIYRLAQESGLSQTTISNIFKRNNQPSLPTVNAICDACGITLAQFFTENAPANMLNAKSKLDKSVAALTEEQREALAAFIETIV